MTKESFYVWREKVDTPDGRRLLTPSLERDYPFDYLFTSVKAAYLGLYTLGAVNALWDSDDGEPLPPKDWQPNGWVLCLETVEELS